MMKSIKNWTPYLLRLTGIAALCAGVLTLASGSSKEPDGLITPAGPAASGSGLPADQALGSLPTLPQLQELVGSRELSAKAATGDAIGYGWNLFFYTNWRALPGSANRGVPDPSKPFGESGGPVVWETWKNTAEVYLPTGAAPAPWVIAGPAPPEVAKATLSGADSGDLWQQMTDDVQVDGFNLLDTNDQKILYELLMDRDAFGYIRTGTLYNVQGQMQWASTKGALNFPWSAMEVKASWRWIDPKDAACPAASYFTTKAWYRMTREMSAGKRNLLQRFCAKVINNEPV